LAIRLISSKVNESTLLPVYPEDKRGRAVTQQQPISMIRGSSEERLARNRLSPRTKHLLDFINAPWGERSLISDHLIP